MSWFDSFAECIIIKKHKSKLSWFNRVIKTLEMIYGLRLSSMQLFIFVYGLKFSVIYSFRMFQKWKKARLGTLRNAKEFIGLLFIDSQRAFYGNFSSALGNASNRLRFKLHEKSVSSIMGNAAQGMHNRERHPLERQKSTAKRAVEKISLEGEANGSSTAATRIPRALTCCLHHSQ